MKEFSDTLNYLSRSLPTKLRPVPVIWANALFQDNIAEYEACLDLLIQNNESAESVVDIWRRICQLSREILFSTEGEHLPENVRKHIAEMNQLSLRMIDSVLEGNTDGYSPDQLAEIQIYRQNIARRAKQDDPWKSLETSRIR